MPEPLIRTVHMRFCYPQIFFKNYDLSVILVTRSDGVVAWQACLEEAGPRRENIEVRTTHIGLGFHPPALWVIADRLAQPFGEWRPFRPDPLVAGFFPGSDST